MSRCIAVVLMATTLACASGTRYVNPSADLSAVHTVAVLPFENLTGDRLSAERVQRIFVTQLLILDAFTVVEPGQISHAIRNGSVDVAALTTDDFKKLGRALKAEALFLGTIVESADRPGSTDGSAVTLQLRLVEVDSGATLWSASRTRKGASVGSRLFGFGAKSSTEVAEEIIRDELQRLVR